MLYVEYCPLHAAVFDVHSRQPPWRGLAHRPGVAQCRHTLRTGMEQVWDDWLPYVTLAAAIFVGVTNALVLTKGMQENEAIFMVSRARMKIGDFLSSFVPWRLL